MDLPPPQETPNEASHRKRRPRDPPPTPNDETDMATIPMLSEDLSSLLQRLCVSEDPVKSAEVIRNDGTINIDQMILINKPQRQELDLLGHEWEKQ